jgi:hypothetical protein
MPATVEVTHPGHLLTELGYLDEIDASLALGVTIQTLVQYRKAGIGPEHTVIARKVFYSRDALAGWLANGGTRGEK